MTWRATLIKHVGTNGLSGSTFGDWWKILRDNQFAVDVRYWPRAAFITWSSIVNSFVAHWENKRHGAEIERTAVPPPLFVLGIWRSGTTHLHNLLAQDDRFAYPNTYEVLYPHTSLTTERANARFMQWFIPATRPMDNVKSSVREPQEDEFALVACGLSFMLGLIIFPRGNGYRQFLSMQNATPDELDAWKSALMRFLRKLSLKYKRPLVLKSPAHTGRIRVLLELFPEAKFVHIHRDPYAVYQSTTHTWRKVRSWWTLQKDEVDGDRIIEDYVESYDAFFAQRHLIPPQNFCEVAFDDLERDPIGEIRRVYESLALPEFAHVELALREYVRSISGYAKNTFPELPEDVRQRIAHVWSRCFDEWGYAK